MFFLSAVSSAPMSCVMMFDSAVATYCVVHAVCKPWMSDKEIEQIICWQYQNTITGRRGDAWWLVLYTRFHRKMQSNTIEVRTNLTQCVTHTCDASPGLLFAHSQVPQCLDKYKENTCNRAQGVKGGDGEVHVQGLVGIGRQIDC